MSNSNGKLLTATDIYKSYPVGKGRLEVLLGLNLEIFHGEIVSIMGASGSGKSTLLHVLGALDRPDSGKVELENTDVFSLNDDQLAKLRNNSIGFVFQFHHLLPEFTALENIILPGMISGKNEKLLKERARYLLERVGLKDREEHRPGELSGGEQQRVAIARALINDPKLILADEPSGNLDRKNSEALHQLIWDLSRTDKRTFLLATHNFELAKKTDRLVILQDGKLTKRF